MKHAGASILFRASLPLLAAAGAQVQDALADAPLPTEFISIDDFTGTTQQKIDAALFAARFSTHKTVFFPNGTYELQSTIALDQGADTEIHLIGESQDGVFLVPDTQHLENTGGTLAHMINLNSASVFNSVDVSIQNMTIDMRDQLVMGETVTYDTDGHGVRIGQGWQTGQFLLNEVTIRNTHSYGVGIQDRGGHPKNNVTLSNLHIERTGSDGIDTKEASGDGNRNLVIQNVNINEVGFLDTGAAPAIDIRYRDAVIDNVNLVSAASQSSLPGQSSTTTGIVFRPFEAGAAGIVGATVSDVYIRGFNTGITVSANDNTTHNNIDISDFRIQGQQNAGIGFSGTNHSGHTVSDGFVDPAFGGAAVNANGQATVTNVTAGRWDPALTPLTNTTFEGNVSLAGETYSPAWEGIVGSERVSLNPAAGAGPFLFDVTDTGVMQVDFDGFYHVADKLIVDGTLNLDGELRLNLIDGSPTQAGVYDLFDATSITGAFDSLTLPGVGGGLFWDTANLGIDGTIALIEAPGGSLLLGDTDNTTYGAADPDDNPPIDAQFQADLQAISASWTFKGLDETGRNDVRAMTFTFDPLAPESLDSVWIEARVFGETGFENDNMILDFVGNGRALASMDGFGAGGAWTTLRYDLDPSEYALLADGQLNLAFVDDTRVDWVRLSWLEAALEGDFNGDGVVDLLDFDILSQNFGLTSGASLAEGDANGDGAVNLLDFDVLSQNFGASAPATVPEPASAVAVLALPLLAHRRRRDRSTQPTLNTLAQLRYA
ncbi:MAG: dockerin type I domain-containing protein [Planctomycetota bacterium]